MKYKIVQLNNGAYQVYTRKNLLCRWIEIAYCFDSLEEAELYIENKRQEYKRIKETNIGFKVKKTVKTGDV